MPVVITHQHRVSNRSALCFPTARPAHGRSRSCRVPETGSIDDIPLGQLRLSPAADGDSREDLHIDITAAYPYLSQCTVGPDALQRYRSVFEANDGDNDGLLNVNQLHQALSVVNDHEIRDPTKDFVVHFLQTAQSAARSKGSRRRKGTLNTDCVMCVNLQDCGL